MSKLSAGLIALAVIAVLLVVLAIVVIPQLGSPRSRSFATRHGLDPTPEDLASVERYLRLTRRRRLWGLFFGFAIPLFWLLPEQRFAVLSVPLLAGWLLGAASAELAAGTAPRTGTAVALPAWQRRTPGVLAAVAVASTALALWSGLGDGGEIIAWGVGALVTCLFVTATVQHVTRRGSIAGTTGAVDRATRTHAVAAVTAVGLVLVGLCLLHQADQVRSELDGQTAHWAGVADIGLTLGVLLLAVALWWASAPGRRPRLVAFLTVVLVTTSAAAVGFGAWQDRPPYVPEAVHPVATIRLTDMEHFDADAAALGVSGVTPLLNRTVLGRLDLAVPQPAGRGRYYLVLIDKRYDRAAPQLFGKDGGTWGGAGMRNAWKRYPWLSALTPTSDGDGWAGYPGMAVSVSPDTTSAGFVGRFRKEDVPQPADLLVALLFLGPQDQLYWAVQVPVAVV
ncbi:hypothetical protein [Catellatospora vulcania]|uniref:hypothetical protein n=1 Tax=Catellatospora vulcania TaxID=1460450 RepID=UPI0012D4515C|nr:hypothetical protein [Catellatospora vulcania]